METRVHIEIDNLFELDKKTWLLAVEWDEHQAFERWKGLL